MYLPLDQLMNKGDRSGSSGESNRAADSQSPASQSGAGSNTDDDRERRVRE
jgi:hypothetical protein